jgi:hypothetical protein
VTADCENAAALFGWAGSPGPLLLQIATLAAVKSVLPWFDLLIALWRDGKPMLLSRVPVQIVVNLLPELVFSVFHKRLFT